MAQTTNLILVCTKLCVTMFGSSFVYFVQDCAFNYFYTVICLGNFRAVNLCMPLISCTRILVEGQLYRNENQSWMHYYMKIYQVILF